MDIVEALNTLQPLVLREGDDCELDALSSIRAALVEALKPTTNSAITQLSCKGCTSIDPTDCNCCIRGDKKDFFTTAQ
jgi:hypothetical protein